MVLTTSGRASRSSHSAASQSFDARAITPCTHLLFMATNGLDLGAVSMMIYGWREREETLRFLDDAVHGHVVQRVDLAVGDFVTSYNAIVDAIKSELKMPNLQVKLNPVTSATA